MAASTLNAYAERHGYDIAICDETLDISRPPAWTKLMHIRNLMNVYHEILWIDADALILDLNSDIKEIIDRDSDLAWVYHEYSNQRHPNSGVMYIQVNDKTRNLIELSIEQRDLDDHPWWDQAALMRVLGKDSTVWPIGRGEITEYLNIHEQELPIEWNSIRLNSAQKPRIRHFAGENFWVRKFLMAEYTIPSDTSLKSIDEVIREVENVQQQNHELQKQNHELQQQNHDFELKYQQILKSRTWRFLSLWRLLRNSFKSVV
jgi:hypothetical protein